MPIPNYPLFTIHSGVVKPGITVRKLTLKGVGKDIPAIIVGESGPGRLQEAVSVSLPASLLLPWSNDGETKIFAASLGKSRGDQWRIFGQEKDTETIEEEVICLFRTRYGFRGSNRHTGDRAGWKCSTPDCVAYGGEVPDSIAYGGEVPDRCPKCGMMSHNHPQEGPIYTFLDFPGRILAKGTRAEGAAGKMARGEELVAVMPRGVVFCTHYTGRLYGAPSAHYYVWTGKELLSATQDERDIGDLF